MLDKKSNVWGVLIMKISYEKRIEATLAYVNQNRTYKEVAKEYDMHPSDLQKWVTLYKNHGVAGLSKRTGNILETLN
ncbi:helix-turn-helix domain-containing protein [Enterococcus rotai]|uniref:helix-turn-helix domain-containing protein n=1 Tax=Enterococcus rotai TaxID=118060 RepID=UPI0032B438EB